MQAALIAGLSATSLLPEERAFFRDVQPAGLILFTRNCHDLEQIRALVSDTREAVGAENFLVLIDQEGGRVQRLRSALGRELPPARRYGDFRIALYASRDRPDTRGPATAVRARPARGVHPVRSPAACRDFPAASRPAVPVETDLPSLPPSRAWLSPSLRGYSHGQCKCAATPIDASDARNDGGRSAMARVAARRHARRCPVVDARYTASRPSYMRDLPHHACPVVRIAA